MPYESWAERNKREEPGRSQGRGNKPGSLGCLAIRERSDNVKLLKLSLNNFKGIKSFTLDAQGENIKRLWDKPLENHVSNTSMAFVLTGQAPTARTSTLRPSMKAGTATRSTRQRAFSISPGRIALKKSLLKSGLKRGNAINNSPAIRSITLSTACRLRKANTRPISLKSSARTR